MAKLFCLVGLEDQYNDMARLSRRWASVSFGGWGQAVGSRHALSQSVHSW